MKAFIPAFTVFLGGIAILNSCSISKNTVTFPKTTIQSFSDKPTGSFVQLNNGTIKHFSTLKLVTGILTTPHLLGDGKVVIKSNEIIAYQNDKHYAVSSKILASKKSAAVSVESLPGFAVKLMSGKLNVYSRKYYNGANTTEEYFLQSGDDGLIIAYSKEALKNLLKEDAKSSEFFNSKSKLLPQSQKILAAVEMYNSSSLMTKN
jgi:hypothetical protein